MEPGAILLLCVLGVLLLLALITAGLAWAFFSGSILRKAGSGGPEPPPKPESPWAPFWERKQQEMTWLREQPLERVEIVSYDGLKLRGYFLPAREKTNKTVLMIHGFHSDPFRDFAFSARPLWEAGYNLLLAEQRSHGASEGKYICFGVKERYDCRGWCEYLENRMGRDSSCFLMGVSMGSATVLMALGLELPPSVKGCVADCGFTTPREIFLHVLRSRYRLPGFPFLPLHDLLCRRIAGFGLTEASTREALERNKLPVLFFHGGQDDFVPLWMTEENYRVCRAEKELLVVKNAAHAMSFAADTSRCLKLTKDFLNRCGSENDR